VVSGPGGIPRVEMYAWNERCLPVALPSTKEPFAVIGGLPVRGHSWWEPREREATQRDGEGGSAHLSGALMGRRTSPANRNRRVAGIRVDLPEARLDRSVVV